MAFKLSSFVYTKDNGEVSNRTIVATVKPSKNVGGIDVSSLPVDQQTSFVEELERLHEDYMEKVKELQEVYGLSKSYRAFKPDNISERDSDKW